MFVSGQDAFFSQFYYNRLYMNPAYSGINEPASLFMNYRNQWPDMQGNYVTYSASYKQPVEILGGGIGILLNNDVQGKGTMNTLQASMMYAYELKVNRNSYFYGSLQASYINQSLHAENLTFEDMFDPTNQHFSNPTSENISSRNEGTFDFAAGILFKYWDPFNNLYIYSGISSHHLTEPAFKPSGSALPRSYTGHFQMDFPFAYNRLGFEEVRIQPAISYTHQGNANLLNYAAIFQGDTYLGGIGIRHNLNFYLTHIILSAGYSGPNYRIAYSYDILPTHKDVLISKWGSHEVTFLINIQYKGKRYKQ